MLDEPSVGFKLTPDQEKQRDAAAGPARHVLAFGGSRSGKTFGFVRCVMLRALMTPSSRHLIARAQNIDVRQSVMLDTFPSVMRLCFPDVPYEMYKADQFVKLDNDAEIWFGGMDDESRKDKVLGREYATIFTNEASQIAFETIVTLRTRLAQNVNKVNGERLPLRFYIDLNPTTKSHWTYREFVQGVRPDNGLPLPEGSRVWMQMNPDGNPNLPPEYLEELSHLPERQRLRFREGQYLSEVPGTLWPVERIDGCRVEEVPQFNRVVVAVDPSGSDGVGGDTQGIVVGARGVDGHAYVLRDASCKLSPAGWGRRAVEVYEHFGADIIVAEANYGGAMVENTIKTVNDRVKVKLVKASRGKHVRAEPIAALYEESEKYPNGRVHHVGKFPELEDQMSAFTTDGYQGSGSPDRADALVWALTELMLGDKKMVGMLVKKDARKKAA